MFQKQAATILKFYQFRYHSAFEGRNLKRRYIEYKFEDIKPAKLCFIEIEETEPQAEAESEALVHQK